MKFPAMIDKNDAPDKAISRQDEPLLDQIIHDIKHYLPAQAALKDFVHHNTLHAFQKDKFHEALSKASSIFGYTVFLPLSEYRDLLDTGKITAEMLDRVLIGRKGIDHAKEWKAKLLTAEFRHESLPRIGQLRAHWKKKYMIDLDALVHPTLFRMICTFLDQGIAIWNFPDNHKGFLESVWELEKNSFTSFFYTKRAKQILLQRGHSLDDLLRILVGDETLYGRYLFDQQFAHPGWSGIVSTVEDRPETLLDRKEISLKEVVYLEALLEIDALAYLLGKDWKPLAEVVSVKPDPLFLETKPTEYHEVLSLWQDAYEGSYYDNILAAISTVQPAESISAGKSFQAMFCLDDRACSLRRHLEHTDEKCETFGTPGFFGVEFFFQPHEGKFYTKLCPDAMSPKYLVKELDARGRREKDYHFTKHSHTLFRGWIISQTLGFWVALKLFFNIFKPSVSPATAISFNHMDQVARLTVEFDAKNSQENGLQIGFTIEEMTQRVEQLLKGIGLVKEFAPFVYVIGHGSSSVNNPHYSAYDCGACSGRPGSVNARVICSMANHPVVRKELAKKGIEIPDSTQFVSGLHDTTRDEIRFYDEDLLSETHRLLHKCHKKTFGQALLLNAKERSRRFRSINTKDSLSRIYEKVKKRSVSLFQPRPELNHATNAVCVVGRRSLTKNLFLDRRSFLNSFDYRLDPDGEFLLNILNAAAPVCGGINLEYFFSRVDNQKFGAGTKLPHNVMGLFGVANGVEGDLRPGLPSQMIEVHDPIRLLVVIEHFPVVVLETIKKNAATYEWFKNEWIRLAVIDPESRELFTFNDGRLERYKPLRKGVPFVKNTMQMIENEFENIPVHLTA